MNNTPCPKYLLPYADIWQKNHKEAILAWFKDAKFGLFLHYGLYSLLHRHEWVMFHDKIPLVKYEQLATQFTAQESATAAALARHLVQRDDIAKQVYHHAHRYEEDGSEQIFYALDELRHAFAFNCFREDGTHDEGSKCAGEAGK